MTSLGSGEIKIIFFGIIFVSVLGAFVALYNQNPIPEEQVYKGETNAFNQSSTGKSDWISNLIEPLPFPLNDPTTLLVSGVIITPVVVLLGYIAVRALKDLFTQWV